jgi:hypothetical protein
MPTTNNTFGNSLALLIFNGTTIANVAINATSSPLTNLFVSLHTSDPAAGGTQSSNEATYTGYGRVSVARTSGGWTVTGTVVTPAANINFPIGTGGSGTATFFGIGFASSGAGTELMYSGSISPGIVLGNGITPTLTTATTITLL